MVSRPPLRQDLGAGWLYAFGYCFIAFLPLLLLGILSLFQALAGGVPEVTFIQWLLLIITIFAGYFVAATIAATAFWITRPLRPGPIGYALSGVIITPIVYGSVAFTAFVAWEPAGRIIFGNHGATTRDAFLGDILKLLGLFAVVGLPVGLFFWWRNRSGAD
jgi:hypothetical protein